MDRSAKRSTEAANPGSRALLPDSAPQRFFVTVRPMFSNTNQPRAPRQALGTSAVFPFCFGGCLALPEHTHENRASIKSDSFFEMLPWIFQLVNAHRPFRAVFHRWMRKIPKAFVQFDNLRQSRPPCLEAGQTDMLP